MCFETMVELDNKWMIKHTTNRLFVFDYIFLLVFTDKSLQHHFHGIKATVS